MKKTIGLILASVMLIVLIAGCGGKSDNGGNASPSASPSASSSASASPSASPSASASEPSTGEVVTLKFATWNDPAVEQKKIDAFMKTHPNIKIEIDKSITWPWDEKLGAAAAAGKLPDVFFVFNGPSNVANGWLADLKPYLDPIRLMNAAPAREGMDMCLRS